MPTVAVEELPEKWAEVLEKAQQGEEFTITRNNIAVARVLPVPVAEAEQEPPKPRVPGSAKHLLIHMAPDFDATPEGFPMLGTAAGKVRIADDFDAPLEEFAEYVA